MSRLDHTRLQGDTQCQQLPAPVPCRVFAKQDRRGEARWAVTGCPGTLDDGEEQEVAWEEHGMEQQQIEISWEISVSSSVRLVKKLPAMQETQVRSLGGEDPLEKGMATHSMAWRIPWTEEPGKLQSMGLQRVRHDWATDTSFILPSCPKWAGLEVSEDPLQLQPSQTWSSISLLTRQKCLWLDNLYCSGCWAELSTVCRIQDFAGLQKVLDLFVIYHLWLIIWANKTAMRFSFCFQHFKASTFLVKTPRPIITWTPIKVHLANSLSNFQTWTFPKSLPRPHAEALLLIND